MTKDERTLAFVNLNGVLGALPRLCSLDEDAAALLKEQQISVGIVVSGGPAATLYFDNGNCRLAPGCGNVDIKLPFASPARFNAMIDGTAKPIPSKGFLKLSFLLNQFTKLTDILSGYLKASPEKLRDEHIFNVSTLLMFRVIAGAVAQIGNEDPVGRASASYISDGIIRLMIGDEHILAIQAKEHRLTLLDKVPEKYSAFMRFSDLRLARALFDGQANAVSCVGAGLIQVGGMISQVDNINRIMGRVALYLA